jgi:hypothetical protein
VTLIPAAAPSSRPGLSVGGPALPRATKGRQSAETLQVSWMQASWLVDLSAAAAADQALMIGS